MAFSKRGREPDEAPGHPNKHRRVQKKPQILDPVPRPHSRDDNEEEPGRPGPPSDQVSQVGPRHSSRVKLPPEQTSQRVQPLQRLKIIPPRPPNQSDPNQAGSTDPGSSHSDTSTCYSQYVANYDVEPGVEATGTPEAKDIEYWGSDKRAAEFIRSQSGLEANWVGIRPLGKGGCGMAGLWEMRDDEGQLIKQMVIKEESYTRNRWKREKSIRKVPDEVKVMSKLNKTHCHAIPRLFIYKRYPHVYKHRIYMEYCPFKDLSVLCKRYGRFRQFLPEPFLWDTFYHLVEAAVAMKKGPKRDKWEFEIVHRDLKPGNVFLGEENAEKGFPFYPVAKTADFGLAVMTNEGDSSNPEIYRGVGTTGYFAPEQSIEYTPNRVPHQLSSRTNVWAIGATMLELLTLYAHADYMNDPDYNVKGVIVDIETRKKPEYSKILRDLIKECLEPEPSLRPKLRRLRAFVKACRDCLGSIYEQSDNTGRARFERNSLLYYVRNEINNMPTGGWEPYDPESPSKPEGGQFRDGWPVVFPRFHDGPEAERKGSNDNNSDDDDDDWPVVFPPFHDGPKAEREGSNDSSSDDDDDDDDNDSDSHDGGSPSSRQIRARDPRTPERMLPKNTVQSSRGRMSNPIVISDDTASENTDNSDIPLRKRARKSPRIQLRQEGAGGEGSESGRPGDSNVRDGVRSSHAWLSDAGAGGAAREDGGIEGLEDSLTDGLSDRAPEAETDDESQEMELESDNSVPPSPSDYPASAHQVPAPAAPAPTPAPLPVVQPVPALQLAPRRLRNGKTFGYF